METEAKKLNCLSSYEGLNRFSLGQISELLRLTKESYCNVKLKCPDTGQHTVQVFGRITLNIFMIQTLCIVMQLFKGSYFSVDAASRHF